MAGAVEHSIATGDDYDIEYRIITPAGATPGVWGCRPARTGAGGGGAPAAGPWSVVEFLSRPVILLPLAAVLLRYPEPRTQRRYERIYLVAAALTLVVLRLVEVTLAEPGQLGYAPSAWWPTVWPSPDRLEHVDSAVTIVDSVVSVAVVPLMVMLLTDRIDLLSSSTSPDWP